MQLCWVAAVGLCGMQGFGDAEREVLGHLSVFCTAGAEWVLGLSLTAALREQPGVQEMRFSSVLTEEFWSFMAGS